MKLKEILDEFYEGNIADRKAERLIMELLKKRTGAVKFIKIKNKKRLTK